jgi:hypothetical protein
MRIAGQVDDRTNGDPGRLQVDDKLRQTGMTVLCASRGAEQRDHIVAVHRAGRPYLLPVDAPAVRGALGAGANARKIRSRSRLAHPDAEE